MSEEGESIGSKVGFAGLWLLLMAVCSLFAWLSFETIFVDYQIYYKDEAFLSNASGTYGVVTEQYHPMGNKQYTFSCGKNCTEHYLEDKLVRVKYNVGITEYELDVFGVYQYDRKRFRKKRVRIPEVDERVQILYNKDNPTDIRLREDLMIQEMSGSWFSRHGHWIWIVIWGIVGVVSVAVGIGLIVAVVVWGVCKGLVREVE
ncbi:MAG: hypothetical protein IJ165_03230 [Proteobacteria bacterium]|nr:hypothetical protein [Pseudomonadota bacterium]